MGRVVGIDLGTTNSSVAIFEGGAPTVIVNAEGQRTTPSVVAVNPDGERLVGVQARNQAILNPSNTVSSVKHLMGQRYDDSRIIELREKLPYAVVPAANDAAWVAMAGSEYSPPEIAAMILTRLKTDAEAYLDDEVTGAVITVPAYFDDGQRTATKDAGEIAGLQVERIINEPTAAALAYGHSDHLASSATDEPQIIAVYDLGGGTFDISIVDVSADMIEVRATNGDTFLGGDDFDELIIGKLIDDFQAETGVNLRELPSAQQRLKDGAVQAKHDLSTLKSATVNLPFIAADVSGPLNLLSTISREDFEQMTESLVERTLDACTRALDDAQLSTSDLSRVLLVGGQTRMPSVQHRVGAFFGKEPLRGINPDEAVALGAAIQAAALSGEETQKVLVDVTPLTLSSENYQGRAIPIIPRNTAIPTSETSLWSTVADFQRSVNVNVLQGEGDMAKDNKLLGEFVLEGIRLAKKGEPQIELTFDVDADGILHASARDADTGAENAITINTGTELGAQQIEESKERMEEFQQQERERREID